MIQRTAAALLIGLGWMTAPASASPILITETATASGTLNGVAFTNAAITLTELTDTLTVTRSGGTSTTGTAAINITLAGFNPFLIGGYALDNGSALGFVSTIGSTGSPDVLNVNTAAASGYAFGAPATFTGTATVQPGVIFTTTAAGLVLNSVNGTASFVVTAASSVPEPSSLALCGVAGLVVVAGSTLRRRAC